MHLSMCLQVQSISQRQIPKSQNGQNQDQRIQRNVLMLSSRSSTFPVVLPSHQDFRDKRFGFVNREDWDNLSMETLSRTATQPPSSDSPSSDRSSASSYHSSCEGIARPDPDTLPDTDAEEDASEASYISALAPQVSYVPYPPRRRLLTRHGVYVSISSAAAQIFSVSEQNSIDFPRHTATLTDGIPPSLYRWPFSGDPPDALSSPAEAEKPFSPFSALEDLLKHHLESTPASASLPNQHQSWFSGSVDSLVVAEPRNSPTPLFDMFDFQQAYTYQTLKMMTDEKWRLGEVPRYPITITSPQAEVLPKDGRFLIHKVKRSLLY